jgi:fructuronate reductase
MILSYEGLKDAEAWKNAGIALPSYDPEALSSRTQKNPVWVHFGIGNIFRIFIGGIADRLIAGGDLASGIICAETFDYDVVDKVYRPFDNLALAVTLHGDGRRDKRVLGSLAEAVKADAEDPAAWKRLKDIFTAPGLQMVSFTITEKGYALRSADGKYLPYVLADMENGPGKPVGAMAVVTALLFERFRAGKAPLALVSMDNVSHNGDRLHLSIHETAETWVRKGFVPKDFLHYLENKTLISFPLTMIDKITPRPGEEIRQMLTSDGVGNMDIVVTSKHTYIAPFVNAEAPEYLVVEDCFPNGRPPLEKAGVYMTDRTTVNKAERMKVTVCLNPIHTALCTYDLLLGYDLFADGMRDPDLRELARRVGYVEGLPVVEDPGILSPEAFLDELMTERFPNPYLGDTSQRIAVDISQMTAIRFGENIKSYVQRDGSAESLIAIPLAIAGWIRYLLAVDDKGDTFELSPDPMLPVLREKLHGLKLGEPGSLAGQLRPILSNPALFGMDLYEAGIGVKIEEMIREMLAGPGAVRRTLHGWLFS